MSLEKILISLTQREKEVLKYVIQGYTNSEIAKKLYISIHTVKVHITTISEKFGVNRQSFALGLIANNMLNSDEINKIYTSAKNYTKKKRA